MPHSPRQPRAFGRFHKMGSITSKWTDCGWELLLCSMSGVWSGVKKRRWFVCGGKEVWGVRECDSWVNLWWAVWQMPIRDIVDWYTCTTYNKITEKMYFCTGSRICVLYLNVKQLITKKWKNKVCLQGSKATESTADGILDGPKLCP